MQLLRRAADRGAGLIDIEADVDDAALEGLARQRLLLSWHDFEGLPADLDATVRAMAARGPGAVKVAAAVADAAELVALREVGEGLGLPMVRIGMGAPGLLSRTHFRAFGSAWTYVAARADRATAPGQLDLDQALAMGMPASSALGPFALVGAAQVMSSVGPVVYNRLFRQRGRRESYLPLISSSLRALLPLLERLGSKGLSITMPLKDEALALCQPEPIARETGAANSLRPIADGPSGSWQGTNTDIEGVRAPLAAFAEHKRALILGSGGAARAAAHACRSLGLELLVSARNEARAATLSSQISPWQQRGQTSLRGAILINATPICGANASPWPEDAPLEAAVVFDLAIGEGGSRLLERARQVGAVALDARAMWVHQGAQQMSWLLREPVSPEELRELLP